MPGLPPQPPALARALALDMVTRFRLRLTDPRDSRLGGLAGETYQLGVAAWTGPRAVFVGFYTPHPDPALAGPDLAARCAHAAQWGAERLAVQGAERADILLIAIGGMHGTLSAPAANPAVRVGALAVDPTTAEVTVLLPPPPDLPTPRDIHARALSLLRGTDAPTLAAVDLAERQTVAGGYAQPARRQLNTNPIATYGLIASFVAVYALEQLLLRNNAGADVGALPSVPTDWWRFVSSAFIHDPNSPFHLIFNSLAMYFVGRLVEQLYGRLVLVATFLLTAVGGGLLWVAFNAVTNQPPGLSIGASGGITGLLGLLVVLGRVQGRDVPVGIAHAMRQYAITYGAMIVLFGLVIANVNSLAHIGGFLSGALVGLVIPPLHRVGGRDLRLWEQVALYAVLALSAVALIFAAGNLIGSLGTSGA